MQATFLYSGLIDYYQGHTHDDNQATLFATYGRNTTLHDLVEEWADDWDSGEPDSFTGDREDVVAAILESFTDEGREDYATRATCEFSEFFADCNPVDEFDDDTEYPVAIILLEW